MGSFLRWFGIVVAAVLLVHVCSHHEHGGVKGIAVPLPNVLFSVALAAITAACVKYGFKSPAAAVAAPFVGGIAGVFASGSEFYGPFAGVVGVLVGTIIVLIPPPHIRRLTNRSL